MHKIDSITHAKDSTLEKKQIIEKTVQGGPHYYTMYRLRWGEKIRLTEEEQELIAKFSERISLPFLQYNPLPIFLMVYQKKSLLVIMII